MIGDTVLGLSIERGGHIGAALVDLRGELRLLPTSPSKPFAANSTAARRGRGRREALAHLMIGLSPRPTLAVVSVGQSRGRQEAVSDVLDVLDGLDVPAVVVPRAEVTRFATGSAQVGRDHLLRAFVTAWPDSPANPAGEQGHGGVAAPLAACLGVAALGGTQPVELTPGRVRALSSVTWPSPLPSLPETTR